MSQRDDKQFLSLYQTYRYENQLKFYRDRHTEFNKANKEAITIGIVLMVVTTLMAGFASFFDAPELRLICLLVAAICPILATALVGYNTLYGFEQQAKLYQDTINNLLKVYALDPDLRQGLSDNEFAKALEDYVCKVEETFLIEQGHWGQLARSMKPPEA